MLHSVVQEQNPVQHNFTSCAQHFRSSAFNVSATVSKYFTVTSWCTFLLTAFFTHKQVRMWYINAIDSCMHLCCMGMIRTTGPG